MNVLVTDGKERSALAVTRSLGRSGCRVVVTSRGVRCLASSSKFCQLGLPVPDPLRNGSEYVEAIKEIATRENIDFIFPMTDQSISLLNLVRDGLPKTTVLACPNAEVMQAVSDKTRLFQLAESLNVLMPKTFYLAGADDLSANIRKIDRYPVVVKPALSKIPEGEGFLSGGVRYASSREELEQLYEISRVLRYPSMIQEKIVGPGTGLFTLYDNNHHLALFSHRRLREKPPSGGVSVVSESVPLDEEMVQAAGRLLSAVGWNGVAMVEFKRDQRDGKAKLMEINGRFWGTLQLAIASGVDFPSLLLDHLQGKDPLFPIRDYRVGHKLKWFFGTLDHLLIRLKYSEEALNLPSGSPSRWQTMVDFFRVWEKNTSFDVFDRTDLRPFWFEGLSYLRQAMRAKG
jgi:predicted ATP-grasp superfamily ATP-dependent carboligase